MLVVVLAYGSESRAAPAALDAAESGKLARWDPPPANCGRHSWSMVSMTASFEP
jgi:hypothetical protein